MWGRCAESICADALLRWLVTAVAVVAVVAVAVAGCADCELDVDVLLL